MFLLSICPKQPDIDTMPVLKTTFYPWTEGSFRPLCYARAAVVEGEGLLFDLQSFERDPALGGGDILDDSCAALTFRFFPINGGALLSAAFNAAGRCQLYRDGQPVPGSPRVHRYAGADEQGWYWGVRALLPFSLLGGAEMRDGHRMEGNIFKFKRTGGDAHMGAVAPMREPFIFSPDNLADFEAVSY